MSIPAGILRILPRIMIHPVYSEHSRPFVDALSQSLSIVCTTVKTPAKKKGNLDAPEHKSLRSGAPEANAELSAPPTCHSTRQLGGGLGSVSFVRSGHLHLRRPSDFALVA